MSSSEAKNSVLKEILEIDREIKRISSDSTYRQIKKNIDVLDNRHFGNRRITIPHPEDMTQKINVRRHSDEIKKIKELYREKESEFRDRLNRLYLKRRELKQELFG